MTRMDSFRYGIPPANDVLAAAMAEMLGWKLESDPQCAGMWWEDNSGLKTFGEFQWKPHLLYDHCQLVTKHALGMFSPRYGQILSDITDFEGGNSHLLTNCEQRCVAAWLAWQESLAGVEKYIADCKRRGILPVDEGPTERLIRERYKKAQAYA